MISCLLPTCFQVIVKQVERLARLRVAKREQIPRDVWEQGLFECYEIAERHGLPLRGNDSLPVQYPSWESVRKQFDRLSRQKNPSIRLESCFDDVPKSIYR